MSKRTGLHMTAADVVAHATKNRLPIPKELAPKRNLGRELGIGSKRKGDRRLKTHRIPNDTEKRYGFVLEAMKRRGDIIYYGFEEITLRWANLDYTPDFFVIRQLAENFTDKGGGPLIEALYVEIKGGHKWEDSIVKFKTARDRFTWARFEMWDYVDGRWTQLA